MIPFTKSHSFQTNENKLRRRSPQYQKPPTPITPWNLEDNIYSSGKMIDILDFRLKNPQNIEEKHLSNESIVSLPSIEAYTQNLIQPVQSLGNMTHGKKLLMNDNYQIKKNQKPKATLMRSKIKTLGLKNSDSEEKLASSTRLLAIHEKEIDNLHKLRKNISNTDEKSKGLKTKKIKPLFLNREINSIDIFPRSGPLSPKQREDPFPQRKQYTPVESRKVKREKTYSKNDSTFKNSNFIVKSHEQKEKKNRKSPNLEIREDKLQPDDPQEDNFLAICQTARNDREEIQRKPSVNLSISSQENVAPQLENSITYDIKKWKPKHKFVTPQDFVIGDDENFCLVEQILPDKTKEEDHKNLYYIKRFPEVIINRVSEQNDEGFIQFPTQKAFPLIQKYQSGKSSELNIKRSISITSDISDAVSPTPLKLLTSKKEHFEGNNLITYKNTLSNWKASSELGLVRKSPHFQNHCKSQNQENSSERLINNPERELRKNENVIINSIKLTNQLWAQHKKSYLNLKHLLINSVEPIEAYGGKERHGINMIMRSEIGDSKLKDIESGESLKLYRKEMVINHKETSAKKTPKYFKFDRIKVGVWKIKQRRSNKG